MGFPVGVYWWERDEDHAALILSLTDLDALLDTIARRADPEHPPIASIETAAGELSIGLGASVSVLCHVPPDGNPPYHTSLGRATTAESVAFYYGGHYSEFAGRHAVTVEAARQTVREYVTTGELPASQSWEET